MTAFGAVISLENTIGYILHSSHFSLAEPSPTIIQLVDNELRPLQGNLKRLDFTRKSKSRLKVNALDARIKEALWKFEDSLETLLTNQIVAQVERAGAEKVLLFSIDLQCLRDDVVSFVKKLKDMEEEYIYELENMAEDEEESIPSTSGSGGTKPNMIGSPDLFESVKSDLMFTDPRNYVISLIGMAGIGKTALAEKIYEDPEILSHFECRAWVRVGRIPKLDQLSQEILAQLSGINLTEEDEITDDRMMERLEGKNCLVVADDVWEREVFDSLINSLPEINNGYIRMLVTARDQEVVGGEIHNLFRFNVGSCPSYVVELLSDEESKELLCEKVFGDKASCPPQLEKAATEIARKCEGLPLLIVTVAGILSKSQDTEPRYWNAVAEERNSVFADACEEISKVLYPSYNYLPQYLKMLFLFMGVFHPDYNAPPSKVINMLTTEGWFLDLAESGDYPVDECVWYCLDQLCVQRSLVLFKKKSNSLSYNHVIMKTCRLHPSWRYVCRREARKNRFYHVLNRLVDGWEEGLKGQRCLSLQNNILFGIKGFREPVRLNCASSTRSLLFFGSYHQYPTPIDVDFKLLRELDALNLRFYAFPAEILTLVQLKSLALTCNGELPSTISKLFNLRALIVHPHMSIRSSRTQLYVPTQIWDMQELEHIDILGKSLVAPSHVASLEKLSTLVGVDANVGTIMELSIRIPNIRKLGVRVELTPCDDRNDLLSCFRGISTLESLKTLKCSIANPVLNGYAVPTAPSPLMLPLGLEKLHLSGTGFSWEYMDVIGSLPDLKVLKLRSYAFRGSTWKARAGQFWNLQFLLIEDTDLVQWKPRTGSFTSLTLLRMKHCYKLEEIHWPSDSPGLIELVNCKPLALTCAEQLRSHADVDVYAFSLFDKKPMEIRFHRSGSDTDIDEDDEDPEMMATIQRRKRKAELMAMEMVTEDGRHIPYYDVCGGEEEEEEGGDDGAGDDY